MLLFCPSCANVLTISSVNVPISSTTASTSTSSAPAPTSYEACNRLECQTCPYEFMIEKKYFERKHFERKEREDVFGGPGAWDNAQKANTQCPREGCDGEEAAFFQVQIRSADEPMTAFYKCMVCGNRWREN